MNSTSPVKCAYTYTFKCTYKPYPFVDHFEAIFSTIP